MKHPKLAITSAVAAVVCGAIAGLITFSGDKVANGHKTAEFNSTAETSAQPDSSSPAPESDMSSGATSSTPGQPSESTSAAAQTAPSVPPSPASVSEPASTATASQTGATTVTAASDIAAPTVVRRYYKCMAQRPDGSLYPLPNQFTDYNMGPDDITVQTRKDYYSDGSTSEIQIIARFGDGCIEGYDD